MRVRIETSDNDLHIDMHINVITMSVLGNGIKSKCIWMGEKGNRKGVELYLTDEEMEILEKTYHSGEFGQTMDVNHAEVKE